MYNQTEKVNIRPKSYLPVFRVSEGDVGRTLTAHLVSDDGDVTIPGGATVTMAGTKPSGLGYTVTGTIDGSDVSFDTDAVMTDEPGRIVSEIRIVQGDTLIGTTNVVLSVEPNPHPDDTTDGRREPLINEITALLESITEQADRAESVTRAVIDMTVTAHESDEATVTKTEGEVINLDFGLPRGPQGIQGIPGEDGQDGVTPDFTIGTVETLAPGEQATATITGTEEDPVLNLGIPRGPKGDKGDPGEVSLETLAKVMVSDTASGTIASFADGSDALPAKSVLVTLNPKQSGSGTPSPSNVRPISGWDEVETHKAGKNLLPYPYASTSGTVSGITYTMLEDGSVSLSGTATATAYINLHPMTNMFVLKAGTYTVSGASGSSIEIVIGDSDNVAVGTTSYKPTFTLTKDTNVFAFVQIASGTVADITLHPQIEIGSTATAYEPYQGHTYTTDLPQTVYGGTLDVVSGELVLTKAKKTFDGTEQWQKSSGKPASFFTYWSQFSTGAGKSHQPFICSYAKMAGSFASYTLGECWSDYACSLYIQEDTNMTTAEFKSFLADKYNSGSPVQVCYELATPTTIQCDPQTVQTLIGDNNVWGGDGVVVDYYADTKLYIEKMLGA